MLLEFEASLPELAYIAIARDELEQGSYYLLVNSDVERLMQVKFELPNYLQLRDFYTYNERLLTNQLK